MRYIVFVRMLVEIRRFIFSLFLPASRVFSTSVFSLIALYLGVAWTSLCLSLSRRICRLSSRCYCVIRIRQLSRCLCSHTRIPGKRDYFSQFAKQMPSLCAALPWQEFVFASLSRFQPFFLFLWPSLPHRALVSPCRPATGFFFSFHLCTRRRVRVRVYSRIHTSLATPLSVSSHPVHPLLDVLGRSLIHVDTQNARIHARRGLHILTNLPTCIVFSEFPTRYAIHREIMIVPNSILLLHLYSLWESKASVTTMLHYAREITRTVSFSRFDCVLPPMGIKKGEPRGSLRGFFRGISCFCLRRNVSLLGTRKGLLLVLLFRQVVRSS